MGLRPLSLGFPSFLLEVAPRFFPTLLLGTCGFLRTAFRVAPSHVPLLPPTSKLTP